VAPAGWQVSMIMTAEPFGTLAAPQQSPAPQMFPASPTTLAGLKVPLDMAFSHLAPAVPLAGLTYDMRRDLIAARLDVLVAWAAR
jgi:hypothetical protein